jgi:hypothetical protein
MTAGGALDLDEIAGAKILEASGVEGLHRSRYVAGLFAFLYRMPLKWLSAIAM